MMGCTLSRRNCSPSFCSTITSVAITGFDASTGILDLEACGLS